MSACCEGAQGAQGVQCGWAWCQETITTPRGRQDARLIKKKMYIQYKLVNMSVTSVKRERPRRQEGTITLRDYGSIYSQTTPEDKQLKRRTMIDPNIKVIKMSDEPAVKERTLQNKNNTGDIKVVSILDSKNTKNNIISNWPAYSPAHIIKLMKQLYPNTATASSQLSTLKSILSTLDPPPPDEFLGTSTKKS